MGKTYRVEADYSKDAGKLGRHNLSFKTGAFQNKKNNPKKNRRKWSNKEKALFF